MSWLADLLHNRNKTNAIKEEVEFQIRLLYIWVNQDDYYPLFTSKIARYDWTIRVNLIQNIQIVNIDLMQKYQITLMTA